LSANKLGYVLCWLAVLMKFLQARQSCVQRAWKKCLRHSEQDPGLRRIRCCTVIHRSEVVVLMRHTFFYLWHLSVGTDVYTRSKPTYMQHMFTDCAFFDLELDCCES